MSHTFRSFTKRKLITKIIHNNQKERQLQLQSQFTDKNTLQEIKRKKLTNSQD